MNVLDLAKLDLDLIRAIWPELPNIEKAIQTFMALEANKDVQAALATAQRVSGILAKHKAP